MDESGDINNLISCLPHANKLEQVYICQAISIAYWKQNKVVLALTWMLSSLENSSNLEGLSSEKIMHTASQLSLLDVILEQISFMLLDRIIDEDPSITVSDSGISSILEFSDLFGSNS